MADLEHFDGNLVRFVGTPENPEWVGVDIVAVLNPDIEEKQRSTYLRGIPAEWKGLQKVQTLGGEQQMITLYEPGVYYLLARSNSTKAVPFQKWVFEEVLPTIRKTGYYSCMDILQRLKGWIFDWVKTFEVVGFHVGFIEGG